jgi:hypothetical protein
MDQLAAVKWLKAWDGNVGQYLGLHAGSKAGNVHEISTWPTYKSPGIIYIPAQVPLSSSYYYKVCKAIQHLQQCSEHGFELAHEVRLADLSPSMTLLAVSLNATLNSARVMVLRCVCTCKDSKLFVQDFPLARLAIAF